ncbi:hypothetical protein GCM10027063_15750 [Promicromonospora xylanilytica]
MISSGDQRVDDRRVAQVTDRRDGVSTLRSVLAGLADLDDAGAPTLAPGRGLDRPRCRATRAALHDYLAGRLLPSRRRRVEAHLDGCAECTRAFIDVREASWAIAGTWRRLAAEGHRGGRHRRPARRRVVAAGA